MAETRRRREKQMAYNAEHGIEPRSIVKTREEIMSQTFAAEGAGEGAPASRRRKGEAPAEIDPVSGLLQDLDRLGPVELVERLTEEMYRAAKNLDFETAASLRDRIEEVQLDHELRGPESVSRERQRNLRRKGRKN